MNPSRSFLEARDFLIAHREDYAAAYAGFRWPQLDHFNWALDYFDPFAQGNDRLALWVVDEHGGDARLTLAAMSERSNRVASFLREHGVRRGDRVLVMLGNVVPLWEITLALMKLGAVISPATTWVKKGRKSVPPPPCGGGMRAPLESWCGPSSAASA